MTQLILAREMALGNGTRPQGFLLGECRVPLSDIRATAVTGEPSEKDLGLITPEEGVEMREIINALRAPDLVTDEPVEEQAEPERPQGATPIPEEEPQTWRKLPVERLALEPKVHEFLRDSGLLTLGQLDDYGKQNQGLTKIKGIGESTEKQIASAMAAVLEVDRK